MDLGTPDQPTPFHDLDAFSALPRLAGLRLSPDGHRLVTGVATPDAGPDGGAPRYVTALWEVDPTGAAGPSETRRVRRSASTAAATAGTAIVELTAVAPGSYIVGARTTLINNAAGTRSASCIIEVNDVERERANVYAIPAASGADFTLPSVITLSAAGKVGFGCEVEGGAGTAEFTQLLLTKVGSATSTGT